MRTRLSILLAVSIGVGMLGYTLSWAAFFNFAVCCYGSPAQGSIEVSGINDNQIVVIEVSSEWSFLCIGPQGQVVSGTVSHPAEEVLVDGETCQDIGNGRRLCEFQIIPPSLENACNGQPGTGFNPNNSEVLESVLARFFQEVCGDAECTPENTTRIKAAADGSCVNLNDPVRDENFQALPNLSLTCDLEKLKVNQL